MLGQVTRIAFGVVMGLFAFAIVAGFLALSFVVLSFVCQKREVERQIQDDSREKSTDLAA